MIKKFVILVILTLSISAFAQNIEDTNDCSVISYDRKTGILKCAGAETGVIYKPYPNKDKNLNINAKDNVKVAYTWLRTGKNDTIERYWVKITK